MVLALAIAVFSGIFIHSMAIHTLSKPLARFIRRGAIAMIVLRPCAHMCESVIIDMRATLPCMHIYIAAVCDQVLGCLSFF